jgi:hypothetical protein
MEHEHAERADTAQRIGDDEASTPTRFTPCH